MKESALALNRQKLVSFPRLQWIEVSTGGRKTHFLVYPIILLFNQANSKITEGVDPMPIKKVPA